MMSKKNIKKYDMSNILPKLLNKFPFMEIPTGHETPEILNDSYFSTEQSIFNSSIDHSHVDSHFVEHEEISHPHNSIDTNEDKIFSRKLFIGGLPKKLNQDEIMNVFSIFGPHKIDWPHKRSLCSKIPPKGYCFLIFNSESSIIRLLDRCLFENNNYFYFVPVPNGEIKKVQVRPWRISDNIYIDKNNFCKLERKYSHDQIKSILKMNTRDIEKILDLDLKSMVFVGGVPRPISASNLSVFLAKRFGPVSYVAISIDTEYNYPKGAGKILFESYDNYKISYCERYVFMNLPNGNKRIELKPFIYDGHHCNVCLDDPSQTLSHETIRQFRPESFRTKFCGSIECLKYYCDLCWTIRHQVLDENELLDHVILLKDSQEDHNRSIRSFPNDKYSYSNHMLSLITDMNHDRYELENNANNF